jgi:hypothetical protein
MSEHARLSNKTQRKDIAATRPLRNEIPLKACCTTEGSMLFAGPWQRALRAAALWEWQEPLVLTRTRESALRVKQVESY